MPIEPAPARAYLVDEVVYPYRDRTHLLEVVRAMILMYPQGQCDRPTIWWVTADAFDRQMADLASYDVVPLSDIRRGNPRHAVITFDGVYVNVYSFCLSNPKEVGLSIRALRYRRYVGGDNAFDQIEPLTKFCTIDQSSRWRRTEGGSSGIPAPWTPCLVFQKRSFSRKLTLLKLSQLVFVTPPGLFAYPHGEHDYQLVSTVRSRFKGAFSCVEGSDTDLYRPTE